MDQPVTALPPQEITLPPLSQGKRRLVVGLSWDDAPIDGHDLVDEADTLKNWDEKVRASKKLNEKSPYIGIILGAPLRLLRHLYVWSQEMWNMRNHVKAHMRVSSSSKNIDRSGRDVAFKQRDLDLICYIYDKNGTFVREIGPDPANMVGDKNSVYHSGEEFTGQGSYDDEQVRLEIDSLPEAYQHFVFVVVSDSGLTFEQCGNFTLRFADSRTEKNYFEKLIVPAESGQHTAYAFCRLSRQGEQWFNQPLGFFGQLEDGLHHGLAPQL